MASVHEIGIAADTRGFDEGVRSGIIKPLEKAEDAFKDLERAASDVGRDGARDVSRLEEALQDARKESERTEKGLRDVGDTGERGFKRLGEKGAEVSGELRQNLGETFSSFRGDLEDLPQIAQDTLGGLAGSGALGGIGGLAATAAGAAGLGLIIGAMDQIDERNQELAQRAGEMAQAFIDAGSNVLSATSIAAASADVITDEDKRKQVQAYADALGIDLATAVRAYVGDANAMKVVDAQAGKAKEENLAIADAQKQSLKELTPEQQKSLQQNMAAIGAQRELTGVIDQANTKFNDQQAVLKGLINDAQGATKEVDDLGNAVYTLPDGTQIMIDAKTEQATTDISKFKGDLDGIPELVTSKLQIDIDTSDFDRKMAAINRRAAEGVSVVVNPTLGRVIQ
ncbi:hypothetical protein HMPREF1529_02676 [Microbacterium sp. oral taxon 186 str. F0373]|nr:hypothetical protein [Microbacterium sp. oral taxon 186]EPD83300.1 hypothetical protein HMPREF1529_02676 [Microbacterium sp. oral taxon 186 str. F0373]